MVQLRDSLDHTVVETVTDERGRYSLPASAAARKLRVLHMGFRPADVPFAPGSSAAANVALAAVPPLLAPVRVTSTPAARCPRQTNTPAALGLLDQVRAGLLATVIAGAQQPRTLTVLSFERDFAPGNADADSPDRPTVARQTVRLQTSQAMAAPFGASRTAAEFVAAGFREDGGGGSRYFAPDATTLVDDDFVSGYCFRVVKSDNASEVGLGFAPPRTREGRIDVDGVLAVDTLTRSLRALTFRYVGLSRNVSALRPGGRVSFVTMPTGVAFIDRWSLRLVTGRDAPEDGRRESLGGSSSYATSDYGSSARAASLTVREIGGELSRVLWPDGREWRAPLGAWRLHVADQKGRPAAGAVARLEGTDFVGAADSAGVVTFDGLLPGPYTASVIDPVLESMQGGHPVEQRVVVTRDSALDTRVSIDMAERVVAVRPTTPVRGPGDSPIRTPRDTSSVDIGAGKSIERLFTGRFAGVEVTQGSDGSLHIRIRGAVASSGSSTEPLFVLDGTPLPQGSNGVFALSPYDIAKIEVLKNAEDVGVYGLRGANGVVLITTKKGPTPH